jgi:hypothetical protein
MDIILRTLDTILSEGQKWAQNGMKLRREEPRMPRQSGIDIANLRHVKNDPKVLTAKSRQQCHLGPGLPMSPGTLSEPSSTEPPDLNH